MAEGKDEDGAQVEDRTPTISGETPEEALVEMRGWLKAHHSFIAGELPRPSPEQEASFEGMRGLVVIARELAKGSEGNPVIVDTADALTEKYVDKFMRTATSTAAIKSANGTPASQTPSQSSVAATEIPAAAAPQTMPDSRQNLSTPLQMQDLLDEHGQKIPAFKLDRRFVPRPASTMPLFSEVSDDYLAAGADASGGKNKDLKTARFRRDLFIELIGDHPVDTYDGSDLQAYISLLTFWPASVAERPKHMTAREIIDGNRDLHAKPLARKALQEGYVSIVKTMIGYKAATLGYNNPFTYVRVWWPNTAAPPISAEPLSAERISAIFKVGVESGLLDNALLPLLGHLTGRRLGLLIHLKGHDFREKYHGVHVAQTSGITQINGIWTRVPYKTNASTNFFVLNDFLDEIGFVNWAKGLGDAFLFPELMRLADPSKSASSYMGRLFERAGVEKSRKKVFHSLRGGQIEDMRDAGINPRDSRFQSGHAIGVDEHEGYGYKTITETRARELARLPLNPSIDYSVFRGLDFAKMAKCKRTRGRQTRP